MGRGKRVTGPIGFMPTDGRYFGARDLHGYPTGKDGIRVFFRAVEVIEHPAGEEINGRRMAKAFWSMVVDWPVESWRTAEWNAKPTQRAWERAPKEWKFGREVAERLMYRLGGDAGYWTGAILPICYEQTEFGREAVWGIRPVPYPWERDVQKRREAMRFLASGEYRPPGLAPDMAAKWDAAHQLHDPPANETPPERQPGEDDERIDTTTESDRHV
jgi:hypothetical protein